MSPPKLERGYESLVKSEAKDTSFIHIINHTEGESVQSSRHETEPAQRIYHGSEGSQYQSFPEFTLKPDINHFTHDTLNLMLLNDESSIVY